MKKQNIFICFLCLIVSGSFGQSLFPVKKDKLWGLIDEQGKIILAPTYEYISEYNRFHWAIARKDGLFALINGQGKELLPPAYEKISVLSATRLAVWKNGLCGLVSTDNKILAKPKYDKITPLTKELFKTNRVLRYGLMSHEGKELLPCQYDQIDAFEKDKNFTHIAKGNKKGCINRQGIVLLAAEYDKIQSLVNFIKAYRGKSITLLILDEQGNIKDLKQFVNETAYRQAEQAQINKKQQALLRNNPNARKPRWTKDGYIFRLTNAAGKNLLGVDFHAVSEDETTGLAMGISQNDEQKNQSYLIDKKQAKIIFKAFCKDIVIGDFRLSAYARASVDTLWDALIDKKGNIRKTLIKQNKPIIITDIGNFDDELISFRSGSQFGLMNRQAEVVNLPLYQEIRNYIKGYAVARKEGKFGLLDKAAKTAIPFLYDYLSDNEAGVFRAKKGAKWGVVNAQNKIIIPFNYDLIEAFDNGMAKISVSNKFGYISAKGEYIIKPEIYCDNIGVLKNGIAWIGRGKQSYIGKNGKPVVTYRQHGYVNQKGTFVIRPEYERIGNFQKIWQQKKGIVKIYKNAKIGFVNYKGDLVIDAIYDEIENFEKNWLLNQGFSLVKQDAKCGYIDHNGFEVLPIIYDFIDPSFEKVCADSTGIARAQKKGKYGYIDYKGSTVIPFLYEELSPFQNGIAIVKKTGRWGVINEKNFPIIKFTYDGIRFVEGSQGKLLELYKKETRYYYIDSKGYITNSKAAKDVPSSEGKPYRNSAARSPKFLYRTDYDRNNLAVVEKKGKQAVVDTEGNFRTKYAYTRILPYSEGLAGAKPYHKDAKKQKFGFINTSGEIVVTPTYSKVANFSDGKAAVFTDQKWGYIDLQGNMIIEPQFQKAGLFSENKAVVNNNIIINEKGESTGKFALSGKIVGKCYSERFKVSTLTGEYHIKPNGLPAYYAQFDEVTDFSGSVAFVKKGEIWQLTREKRLHKFELKFTKKNKNLYIEQYGKNRKQKDAAGQTTRDMKWEKIMPGTWRMIDRYGNFPSHAAYTEVIRLEDGIHRLKVEQLYGIADFSGKIISRPENQTIHSVGENVLHVEAAGKVGYFDIKNRKWLWTQQ